MPTREPRIEGGESSAIYLRHVSMIEPICPSRKGDFVGGDEVCSAV